MQTITVTIDASGYDSHQIEKLKVALQNVRDAFDYGTWTLDENSSMGVLCSAQRNHRNETLAKLKNA